MAESMNKLVKHLEAEFLDPSSESHADFLADVESWARVHGLLMGNGQPTPVTLVGHPMKRQIFDQAIASGPLFARLVQAVSMDREGLNAGLASVPDPFTRRLLDIFNTVSSEGIRQPLSMGIHRSDYMIHQGSKLQQVEINTISSAFGALSPQMPGLHTHIIQNWTNYKSGQYHAYPEPDLASRALVPNSSLDSIVDLFAAALKAYSEFRGFSVPSLSPLASPSTPQSSQKRNVAVLMIVQPGERNSVDQRWIQYQMEQKHGIHLLRHSLSYVHQHGQLDSETGVLTLNGYEIAVAYYRAGYTPTDYPTEAEWEARLKVERSTAIKCPNIGYHLVGTKKMQQLLAKPGELEKYLTNQDEVNAVRACFAGLYSLSEGEEGAEDIVARAIAEPANFVMKPQREGGGHLLTKDDMVAALKTMSPSERSNYILMDRIVPEAHETILLRDSHLTVAPCIAELGVFCAILAKGNEEIVNNCTGWLLRSKPETVEDGGVAAGRAYLDCPYFI